MSFQGVLDALKGQLIVSCQARNDNPLTGPVFMAAMARAAELGGAGGIRANGPEDVEAIRRVVSVPIIGINKQADAAGRIIITPDFPSARVLVEAGSDVVAISGALYQRPDRRALAELIQRIRSELRVPVMADCATVTDGVVAAELGADIVATTLSGYTPDSVATEDPDLELIAELSVRQPRPVIAEGRIWTPEQAVAAFRRGAHAVVVGTAITNPQAITARYVKALR